MKCAFQNETPTIITASEWGMMPLASWGCNSGSLGKML